uniref:RT_RNaseH domain-containing protein n=1 Tax=Caenorhabditis japonica TaxID=281687 RepID=A0A8R1DYE0_CAEJA
MGAIIFALRQFRPYVCLSKIILHSDHKPLTFLLQKSRTHDNLARWLIELQCYDVSIVHIDGKKNSVADCLSRALENSDPTDHTELRDIVEFPICMKVGAKPVPHLRSLIARRTQHSLSLDIVEEQEKDTEIAKIREVLQGKATAASLPESQLESIDRIINPTPDQCFDKDPTDFEDFREEIVSNLREAWTHAKQQADQARDQFTHSYNQQARPSNIKVGDRVLFKNYKSSKSLSRKLVLPWEGQYRVIEINQPEAIIQNISHPSETPRRVHLDQIKKFFEISGPAATSVDDPTSSKEVAVPEKTHYEEASPETGVQVPDPNTQVETLNNPEVTTSESVSDKADPQSPYNLRKTINRPKRFL